MSAWKAETATIVSATIGASETDALVVDQFGVTPGGAKAIVVDMYTSSVTVAAGITAKIQDSSDGTNWNDVKTGAIANGSTFTSISLLAERAADQSVLPMRQHARLVVTTGAGDTVTFDKIRIIQDRRG